MHGLLTVHHRPRNPSRQVLLRDLRPAIEFFGEFGGKFAMNQKFNNAMLSMRKNSELSKKMLDLACQHPKSVVKGDVYGAFETLYSTV